MRKILFFIFIFLNCLGLNLFAPLRGEAALAVVEQQALAGVIDETGREILPLAYEQAVLLADGNIAVKKQGRYGVLNAAGEWLLEPKFSRMLLGGDGTYFMAEETAAGERWGAFGFKGEEMLPCKYAEIYDSYEGVLAVKQDNGYWRLMKAGDTPVDDQAYDLLSSFSEGLIAAQRGGSWGFLRPDGTWAAEPKYESVMAFMDGKAAVLVKGRWGFIDKTGKEALPPAYYGVAYGFSEGLCVVRAGKSFGVIDERGKLLFKKNVRTMLPYKNGLAEVRKDAKSLNIFKAVTYGVSLGLGRIGLPGDMTDSRVKRGFIDRQGREVISAKYDSVGSFRDGLVTVHKGKNWGALDSQGKVILPLRYEALRDFSEGLAAAKEKGRWLVLDKEGRVKLTLPEEVQEAGPVGAGLIPVKVKSRWGYMNLRGEMVIEPLYTRADAFKSASSGKAGTVWQK